MDATLCIEAFYRDNSIRLRRILSKMVKACEIDDTYSGFILSMLTHSTLSRYDSGTASFDTYINKCLKNYVYSSHRRGMVDKNSDPLESCDPYLENESFSEGEFHTDLFKFYKFYRAHVKDSLSGIEEGEVLKALILKQTPHEISTSLSLPLQKVYYIRKKLYMWYKSYMTP